jgi:PAS domain S-box-containing protein
MSVPGESSERVGSSSGDGAKPRSNKLRGAARLEFLAGGGEMGARMRALDWSTTPLGAPEQWPQSLKTIVRVMLDSRYAMWMLWGPEFTFFCNDAYLPTLGIKGHWALGARSDKVWAEIWPDISTRIDDVLKRGQATWDERLLLYLERSGFLEETYHTFSYSPVYNDENQIAGMLCVVTEVTGLVIDERRLQALRELAASRGIGMESVEQSCQRLCETLARYPLDVPFAALYLVDHDRKRARRVARTGQLTEQVMPSELAMTDSPWPLAQMMSSQSVQNLQHLPQLGIEIPAGPWPDLVQRGKVLPLRGSGQQGLVGFLIVGISPRRPLDEIYRSFLALVAGQMATAIADAQAFEAQRQRAEALAEIDRAKTTFFSNVSHEFRTPLTLMLGPLEEAIADPRLVPELRERLTLAQRNSLRLLKLVNSLLDFSRIEAGRMQATYQPTDLAAFTRDLASSFRSAIERAGLRFEVDCPGLEQPIYVDREMWEKIVLNLLSNAFKFTFAGQIAVRLHGQGDLAVLEVADSGVGIPAPELPRLFERFYRIEGSAARTHEGSGIGLALVQELVRLHAGTIEVASQPSRGTTFTVRLPLGRAHLPGERIKATRSDASTVIGAQAFVQEALRWLPDLADSTSLSLPALAEAVTPVRDQRFAATFGARIILADDNADMRAYMRELLAPTYSVEAVADGEQALAAARAQRPDLIISDVMMPRLDGFGLLAALRSDKSLRSVPIVLLSARAGEEARIEGLDAGADDYLTKPFSARELVARVGALLELANMRQQAEEALRRRTAQFETLLNEAPLGVYLVDADFRLREVNPRARATYGDVPKLIGADFEEMIRTHWHQPVADDVLARFRHTLETGESYVSPEHIEQRRDRGVTEYYEWQIHRITLPEGRYGVVCYFRDISAHIQARSALQAADRQKDEFLAMLAHELRNPLAPLRNASELLSIGAGEEPRTQFSINVIKRQVTQLTRLVDDLLDISRITQGRIELNREPLELGAIIAQAVETVEPVLREKGHRMSILSSYQHLYVDGDNARLVQCVSNILTNAAKYTDAGGDIQLRSYAEGPEAVIEISDNGCGISAELLPRMFDLFVQGDRTLDRSQGGLGIGLSVVRRLVEMHGGEVTARSPGIGQGSVFAIRLPLIERPGTSTDEPKGPTAAARRVLIVDDNKDAADTLALLLQFDGHETRAVYTARDAIEEAQSIRPDVMLLDIGLPEMNGYEVAKVLRALPALAGMRLIALTGYGQAIDRERAQLAGFDEHLTKPVNSQTLQQALAGNAASGAHRRPPRWP